MSVLKFLIGFMDEEVAPVLSELIDRGRPVLAIERGVVGRRDRRLFQRPRSAFTDGEFQVTVTGGDSGAGTTQLARQQRELTDRLADLLTRHDFVDKLDRRSFFLPGSGNTVGKEKVVRPYLPDGTRPAPTLSVIRFDGDEDGLPVVLVRAPEMGMQPSLVRPYLRLIAESLTCLLDSDDTVELVSFGASGAIGDSQAGEEHELRGSLFVGASHDELGDGEIRALVASATPGEVVTLHEEVFPIGRAEEVPAVWDAATGSARAFFLDESNDLGDLDGMSLTLSFFGGRTEKERAAELGLSSVNTEDYHVFRLARAMHRHPRAGHRRYPPLAGDVVRRIDVDPPAVTSEVERAFVDWARAATIDRDEYVELIVWGAQGFPMHEEADIPKAAWWTFADDVEPELFGRYAPTLCGDVFPLDPFAVEIAADLVADAANGEAVPGQNGTVTRLAGAVRDTDPDDEKALARAARALVAGLELGADGRVWIRTKKWAGNPEPWLDTVLGRGHLGTVVDRAFYRSSNLLALAELAAAFRS